MVVTVIIHKKYLRRILNPVHGGVRFVAVGEERDVLGGGGCH